MGKGARRKGEREGRERERERERESLSGRGVFTIGRGLSVNG